MKTITINFTHDEVFKDFAKDAAEPDSKYVTVIENDNGIIMNITGTLKELENE